MPIDRLREFVLEAADCVGSCGDDEASLLDCLRPALADLVMHDDWLPEAFAQPHPVHYQQYLLHCDPQERFSVVSFVWGPGQATPVHDHTVWGLIGVLRGAERCEPYVWRHGRLEAGESRLLTPGAVDAVSPRVGDVHRVSNAYDDRVSISIHVYGANIGAVPRHVFDAETGTPRSFVSGYASAQVPNLWDRSAAVRATLG